MKHMSIWGSFALAAAAFLLLLPLQAQEVKKGSQAEGGFLSELARQVQTGDGQQAGAPVEVKDAKDKAGKAEEKTKFIRVKRDADKEPVALQTNIVRFVPAKGKNDVVVDLVGVVHVGERGYYHRLNDRFDNYDVVLYELVAPKGVIPRPGRDADNPLAMLQKAMTLIMRLDLQTNCIDYTPTNFVHADLTPEEMEEKIKKRGDTPLTLALSIAADVLREQNLREMRQKQKPGKQPDLLDLDLLELLADPQMPVKLKRLMAEQLEELGGDGSGLGKTLDTILIDDRNAAAMKVLQKQLVAGKKKIAIFYGAAHMPDFERRLVEDFGMRRQNVEWITAWDLRPQSNDLFDLLKRLAP